MTKTTLATLLAAAFAVACTKQTPQTAMAKRQGKPAVKTNSVSGTHAKMDSIRTRYCRTNIDNWAASDRIEFKRLLAVEISEQK